MRKALIFDLDGTLVYTLPSFKYEVMVKTLSELGMNVFRKDEIDEFWYGTDRDKIIEKYFRVEPQRFWEIFSKYNKPERRVEYTEVYEDVHVLRSLKEKYKLKLGIITSNPYPIAKKEVELLEREGIEFDSIVTPNYPEEKPKPNAKLVERCLKELGVEKKDVVLVGNGKEDWLLAKNAGIPFILIEREDNKLEIEGNCEKIKSLYELEKFLENI
ncbi:MAG: hypothetical protein DRP00_02665 [Candidatus Aenigmatarchaeota archaeon]|nr:MAG: hypothetical protein DRP00_02665 [Candidatus Aenigmarchaeota archaeon]